MKASADKVSDYRLEASRNFRGTPFTPIMTKEAKLKVERKCIETLGDLYGTYHQIHKLSEENKELLISLGVDPTNKNEEFDAGGVNDDWPVGRGVFIQDSKKFLVLVNFEQHIKFIVMRDHDDESDSIKKGIENLIMLLRNFEKLGFASDSQYGYLTVSPKDLGTAMKLSCTLNLDTEKQVEKSVTD